MRLLEIASAEEQIALWRLVSDNVWAALQLQQDQHQRAAVSTAARDDANPGVATKVPKSKSRGKGTKNPALKRVLRSYGKVPKLPSVPVPPKPGANSNTQPGKPEPAGAANASGRGLAGSTAMITAASNMRPAAGPTTAPIKSLEVRGTTQLDPTNTQAPPSAKNQAKTTHSVDYRGILSKNTTSQNDQRPDGRQA
jgi:hypothetical protein